MRLINFIKKWSLTFLTVVTITLLAGAVTSGFFISTEDFLAVGIVLLSMAWVYSMAMIICSALEADKSRHEYRDKYKD